MEWLRRRSRRSSGRPACAGWLDLGSATRTGPRPENQDRAFVTPTFAGVSDGMGGYAGGATAAELTVAATVERLAAVAPDHRDRAAIQAVFDQANDAVRRARDREPGLALMGATLTLAALLDRTDERSRWFVASLGDSPALHVRPSATSRITVADTVPARLLHDGVITEAEADAHPYRHMVIHAVGVEPTTVDVAPVVVELEAGDSIVLLSDGVSDVLDVDEIGRLVRTGATAQAAADAVADGAVDRATGDNATLVVVRHVASSTGDRARP